MGFSRLLNELHREVAVLRKQFLPPVFEPTGLYADPDHVQSHTRAFLVLCHAAVETYLEAWAKDLARTAEIAWASRNRVTIPLVHLVGARSLSNAQTSVAGGGKTVDAEKFLIEECKARFPKFYKLLKANNGVKESNVLLMFSPLGVPVSAFGGTLLPTLEAFGADRGAYAHNSSKAVPSALDPASEYTRISAILGDLERLDAWLSAYKRRIR